MHSINLPLTITDRFERPWLERAANLKAAHKISVADSLDLSLAQQLQAPLVTADHHEFDEIEKADAAQFHWIR